MSDPRVNYEPVRHGFSPAEPVRFAADELPPPPLRDQVSAFVDQSKRTIKAERDLLAARAAVVGTGAKRASVGGAVAILFGSLALIALTVGMVLWLATLVGPLLATAIVAGVLFLIAAIGALSARSAVQTASSALRSRPDYED